MHDSLHRCDLLLHTLHALPALDPRGGVPELAVGHVLLALALGQIVPFEARTASRRCRGARALKVRGLVVRGGGGVGGVVVLVVVGGDNGRL